MKYIRIGIGMLLLFFTCIACSRTTDEPVGGDWHVWGIYDFAKAGDMKLALLRVKNQDAQFIGYDIYADGDTRGALLCEIRCTDGGYTPEEISPDDDLLYEDHDRDGRIDIGMPTQTGDILWYHQKDDGQFLYSAVQSSTGTDR